MLSIPDISYISDINGQKTAVVVPIQWWASLLEMLERERASEEETAYLSQSAAMKRYILESRAQTESISFEEAREKLGV